MKKVPESLRKWFLVHFTVDLIVAIPLIIFPGFLLKLLGMPVENIVLAQILGAGLLGIGGVSFYAHKKGAEVYKVLIVMKRIWSLAAIIVLFRHVWTYPMLWFFFVTFVVFYSVWTYYNKKL